MLLLIMTFLTAIIAIIIITMVLSSADLVIPSTLFLHGLTY